MGDVAVTPSKPPRLVQSSSGDHGGGNSNSSFPYPVPDGTSSYLSSLVKPHVSNDRHHPPSSAKTHSSSDVDFSRGSSHRFEGGVFKSLFPVRFQWPLFPLSRRLCLVGALTLLLLAFSTVPVSTLYPSRKQSILLTPRKVPYSPPFHIFHGNRLKQTLLDVAKVDLGENAERAQINAIAHASWDPEPTRSRFPFWHNMFRHEDHYSNRIYERRRSNPGDPRLPVQLKSPRYAPFWSDFRSTLRAWVENKRYDPHIMAQLLRLVKDPVDKHYLKIPGNTVEIGKPYKTCAVVGNSGILLNQSYASLIDSHDMVMRLNNARVQSFEQYVGSKTTLSFVNSNIFHACARRPNCHCHPYGPNVPIIMYTCQVVHLMDVVMCGANHVAPIIVTDARLDTLCARIVKYYSLRRFVENMGRPIEEWSDAHEGTFFHYSSGMQAILLAVGICEEVSVFGFGKNPTARHHYHTPQKAELSLHDYAAEYDFYMDLAAQDPDVIPFLNEAGFSLPLVHIYW
ncbi:hypothetical protein KP509_21G044200 [Ceratopteris richardii]|uniref:Uncharacterized protein n=1 Tax=Ceratopteris richardii TaxID=49495 RepID=A0A8T2SCI9_CERRI|nr:hypothetical protein KP509_21G044200 [Ceratopteris richardii]